MTHGPMWLLRATTDRLSFRIAFLLAVVLFPLTLAASYTASALMIEARGRAQAALKGETVMAAGEELRNINRVVGAAEALALILPPLAGDATACTKMAMEFQAGRPEFSFVGLMGNDNVTTCSTRQARADYSDQAVFKTASDEDNGVILLQGQSKDDNQHLLTITAPAYDTDRNRVGYVALSIPHTQMQALPHPQNQRKQLDLLTYDIDGDLLTASVPMEDAQRLLPKDRALAALTGPNPVTFADSANDDTERVYAVVPLVAGQVFALGIRDASDSVNILPAVLGAPVLVPGLIWLASLIVSWLAVEYLVIRHVRRLSTSITAFAQGARIIDDVEMDGAAFEIREIAAAYESLTDNVIRNEAELEYAIHEREVLLREVHHRVKNNLQLIASIMSMQIRREKVPKVRIMLKALQDRVLSLASVHREMLQTSGLADIHADELLHSILQQIASRSDVDAGPAARGISITDDIDPVRMTPDQAVPLALLLTEAINTAIQHLGDLDAQTPQIHVAFKRRSDGKFQLSIIAELEGKYSRNAPESTQVDLGTQLMIGFGRQLGAKLEQAIADGRYRATIIFDLMELAQGDANAPA
ncbi:sensor histidine kinase [Pseudorhodobacter sp.]|uniref:sensor histidine kinase n=1 Tax=Pseudorhodobacter sp. TaxID=1934400 RepID=UPI002647AE80|nr:sensor histidine kinase [Pseudorhodobacter sp.]MDN5787477.1 sensor histidine kinase [Pseudorhodobacter sp.]